MYQGRDELVTKFDEVRLTLEEVKRAMETRAMSTSSTFLMWSVVLIALVSATDSEISNTPITRICLAGGSFCFRVIVR